MKDINVSLFGILLTIKLGDITQSTSPVIVTAANRKLAGGGGVDKAIWDAAGEDELVDYLDQHFPNGTHTGFAIATPGFKLCKTIIHAVGPKWKPASALAPILLHSAYWNSMSLVDYLQEEGIAFPTLSTGMYGYPLKPAITTALQAVTSYIAKENPGHLKTVEFYAYDQETFNEFRKQIL